MSEMNHKLFTELSSEQAAAVEGGLALKIHKIQCIKAGADGFFGGNDDMTIHIDGSLRTLSIDMNGGRTKTFADFRAFNSGSSMSVDLFDADSTSQNDHMGGFTARSTGGQVFSKQVSGSGSRYRIFYSAV